MKNECEPYLGITTDYDDEGICDVELRLILPKAAWEDFEKKVLKVQKDFEQKHSK